MRYCYTLLLLALTLGLSRSVHAQQPFLKYGVTVKVASLSNGRFQEFFTNDSLRRIGSVVYDTRLRRVAYLLPPDSLVGHAKAEVASRWMSPDPLAEKFMYESPYVFVENNPIRYMDPDGREFVDPKGKTVTYTTNKDGSITFSKNATESLRTFITELSKNEVGRETLTGLRDIATKVGVEVTEERGLGYNGPEVEGHTDTKGSMIDPKTGKEVYKTAEIVIFMGTHEDEKSTGNGNYSKSSSGKFVNGIGTHEATHILKNHSEAKRVEQESRLKDGPLKDAQKVNFEILPNAQERKANTTYP